MWYWIGLVGRVQEGEAPKRCETDDEHDDQR
jgi:hypothetical protein